jgi:hypothetical protein
MKITIRACLPAERNVDVNAGHRAKVTKSASEGNSRACNSAWNLVLL